MKRKGLKWIAGLLVAAAGVIAALPFLMTNSETRELDDAARRAIGGDFIRLSDGYTHYRWEGPETGPVVILVHGFSTPMFNWDRTAPALAAAGFRVLRYDLFGRGFSDRPRLDYTRDLFDRQLLELIGALKIRPPVTLVGLSMGGAVSTVFAARHPELVERLGLISPAGFPVEIPLTGKLVRFPLLGSYLMRTVGEKSLLGSVAKALHRPDKAPEYMDKFRQQMQYRGFKRAIVSTLRHFDLSDQKRAFETAGRHPRPVILFWGRQDRVIPFEHSTAVLGAMPRASFHPIEGAGHCPQYENPQQIIAPLKAFLKSQTAASGTMD